MGNQKGSGIAIVLIVLGVVSLMGVAALLRSRLDLQLSSAMHSHQTMVNVADAAATAGVRKLQAAYTKDWVFNVPSALSPSEIPNVTPTTDGWAKDSSVAGAEMKVTLKLLGPGGKCPAGWSQSTTECLLQSFLIEGKARRLTYLGSPMDLTSTVVQVWATKIIDPSK
jgi:type II secretory pathway pseudopilin PulG